MANLPQVPRRLVTVDPGAGRSRVSAAERASPYRDIASGLAAIGEFAEDVAVAHAPDEGANAVEYDESGQLRVTLRSPVTRAGQAYNQAAKSAYAARLRQAAEPRLLELRQKHPGNPEAFRQAAEGYVSGLVDNAGASDPVLRGPVATLLGDMVSRHYQGIQSDKHRRDIEVARTALGAEVARLEEEGYEIARGGGAGTAAFADRRDALRDLYDQLAGNPEFDLTPAQAEAKIAEIEDKWTQAALLGASERVAEAEGAAAGLKAIDMALAEADYPAGKKARLRAAWRDDVLRRATARLVDEGRYDEARGLGALIDDEAPKDGVFKARLKNSESGGRADVVNPFGFAGLYQFGAPRLATLGLYRRGAEEDFGTWNDTAKSAPGKWSGTFTIDGFPEVKTLADFLASPEAQEKTWRVHVARMDGEIERNGLDKYLGESVDGTEITRDALYAMLHLGGVGSAKAALEGRGDARDANGVSVMDYARLGAGASTRARALGDYAESLIAKRNRALSNSNREEARAARKLVADDLAAMAATGEGMAEISHDRVAGVLGDDAAREWSQARERARLTFETVQDFATSDGVTISARLAALKPKAGDDGFAQKTAFYNEMTKAAAAIAKERSDDPARAAQVFAPVAQAYAAYRDAFLDQNATPDDLAAAARAYASEVWAAQDSLGITNDARAVLPREFAAALAQRLGAVENGQDYARVLQEFRRQWGERWPQVFSEIGKDLPPAAQVVAVMDLPGQALGAERLAEAARIGEKGFDDLIGKDRVKEVRAAAGEKAGALLGTFINTPGHARAFDTYRQGITLLAMWYTANGMSPGEAAGRAFNEVIGQKYTIAGSARIPTRYDAGQVMAGAEAAMAGIATRADLDLPDSLAGLTGAQLRENYVAALRAGHYWLTAPDESGLDLYNAATGSVVTAGGAPVSLGWGELLALGLAAPSGTLSPEEFVVP